MQHGQESKWTQDQRTPLILMGLDFSALLRVAIFILKQLQLGNKGKMYYVIRI